MDIRDASNSSLPSTNFEYRKVIMRAAPAKGIEALSGAKSFGLFGSRKRTEPVTVTLKYHGGAEASVLVKLGKTYWRFPGHVQLIDVFNKIYGEAGQ